MNIAFTIVLLVASANTLMAQVCQCGFQDGQFTLINTTLDGNMGEWGPVLNDLDNNSCDGTTANDDLDGSVQGGRNLMQFAFTWDNTYLSGFTRRAASENRNVQFIYYADTNTDGVLSTGEPVVVVSWKGSNRNVEVNIGSYDADNPGGDSLVDANGNGDGYSMPGEILGIDNNPEYSGTWGSSTGQEMEWHIQWSDLGVPSGTAISWHVSTAHGNNFSKQINDNLGGCGGGAGGTGYADIEFTQSSNKSVPTNSDVYLPHTITNNGNVQDTLDFETSSSGDFSAASVQYYEDVGTVGTFESSTDILLTDTDGDGFPDTGDMDPGESKNILVKIVTPSGPINGTATFTTTATSNFIPPSDPNAIVTASVDDTLTLQGVTVSGTVFSDDNHNGTNESGESGISGVTMVLHNTDNATCQSVQTDGNGFYEFQNVLPGSYEVIEAASESVPNPGSCPPAGADPSGYVSTTANIQPITVNNNPIMQQFGDFEGTKITGTVFNDNGIDGGTANDGTQNGGETGIDGVTIEATDNGGTVLVSSTTAGDGSYTIFVPASAAPDGSTIKIKQTNKTGFLSVAGNAGTSGSSYDLQTDEITFTNNTGSTYTALLFADVQKSRLLTDGQQNLVAGSSGTFPHKFTAKTDGDVTFSIQSVNSPSGNDFSPVLYQDNNCNQTIDSGEPILTNSNTLSLTANQTVCLLLKVTVPQGASNGDSSTITLSASFSLANTSPVIQQTASRTDLVNVTDTNSGLSLGKSVDKSQALPGELITYTITYSNNGTQAINSLEVTDNVPAYTTYSSSNCNTGSLPNNLTGCSTTAPNVGDTGTVTWTFSGSLQPGESGTITYQVQIEN